MGRELWAGEDTTGYRDRNVTAQGYMDNSPRPTVLPAATWCQLLHDSARPHTARIVQHVLAGNNFNVLPLPACSRDMFPIKHQWDVIDRRVRQHPHPQANQQEKRMAMYPT